MSHELQAVSTERAVEIVRAWALHTWPMRVKEGVRVYTDLGFRCAGSDPEMFTSDLSPDEDVSYFTSDHGVISNVWLQLSNVVPEEGWAASLPRSREVFESYVAAFSQVFGAPYSRESTKSDFSAQWFLDNGAGVEVGGDQALVTASVESPEYAGYHLSELEDEENGIPLDFDYF
ncbi:DUF6301 family protein [Schaalia georgiae]|uniref:DUF6301 family protein n=1 Tax=Schaalia georgiae TaxID=52768 RepID=UPI0003FEB483|nr:DUF6301 family protein [Schaalia georgiae]